MKDSARLSMTGVVFTDTVRAIIRPCPARASHRGNKMKHLQYRNAGVLLAGVMSVGAVQAQAVKGQEAAQSDAPIPAVTDWSSRSVIHRKPMTPDEFEAAGRSSAMSARRRCNGIGSIWCTPFGTFMTSLPFLKESGLRLD